MSQRGRNMWEEHVMHDDACPTACPTDQAVQKPPYLSIPELFPVASEVCLLGEYHDNGRGWVREEAILPGDVALHRPAI